MYIFVFILLVSAAFCSAAQLTDEEKEEILRAHNTFRGKVEPIAIDMEKMVSGCFIFWKKKNFNFLIFVVILLTRFLSSVWIIATQYFYNHFDINYHALIGQVRFHFLFCSILSIFTSFSSLSFSHMLSLSLSLSLKKIS